MEQNLIGRKENKAFMILSALGILFVVDVHLGSPLGVLTRIFPYDSFFMPLSPAIFFGSVIVTAGAASGTMV